MTIEEEALQRQQKAHAIIQETNLIPIWESIGAEIRQVGSLRMGLLMKHRDIDFHIYSAPIDVSQSFEAMAKLAENPRIQRIEYRNLIDTDERCIEWHAWYLDTDNELWQLDLIQILKGSFYDGYFENIADHIVSLLTPETKHTILKLKRETPDDEKIMGIEYYKAVLQSGIRTYPELLTWRAQNPVTGIMEW